MHALLFTQPPNLATCLGPNLLRTTREDLATLVADTASINTVAAFILEHGNALFSVGASTLTHTFIHK